MWLKRWALVALLLLAPLPLWGQKKVACIGDSVTEGLGLARPEEEAYPAQLQQMIGSNYLVANFGKSGATLLRKGHSPYHHTEAFAKALQFGADIAVIHLGLNDTDPRNFPHYRNQFLPDYLWLIDTLQQVSPHVEIYVYSLTPIFTGHSRFTSSTYEWHQLLQQEIQKVLTARPNVHFIDLFSALRHRPDLITDAPTLHPNNGGATLIARTVYQHITGNYGGLSVAPIWGNNMVLQKLSKATIQGLANSGTIVEVEWRGYTYTKLVGKDGKWSIELPTGPATQQPLTLVVKAGKEQVHYHNLLVGQVWLAMGQSNMQWPLKSVEGGSAIANSNPQLRLFKWEPIADTGNFAWGAEVMQSANDLRFFQGEWQESTPEQANEFSAIGYAFAQQLQEQLGEPVGIVQLTVGGSPLISWVSRATLLQHPRYHAAFVRWREKDYLMRWCRERANTNLAHTTAGHFQRHPYEPTFNHEAGWRYLNGMPLAGLLWYQGESDAENAELHHHLFPLFVQDMRASFGKELPIYTIQLSSIERPSWPYFRDAQRRLATQLEGVHLVVSHDLGHPHDVHPRNKLPLAQRTAQLVLTNEYHHPGLQAEVARPLRVGSDQRQRLTIFFDELKGKLTTTDGGSVQGLVAITQEGTIIPLNAWVCDGCQQHIHFELPKGITATHIAYAWAPYAQNCNVVVAQGQHPLPTFLLPFTPYPTPPSE